MDYRDYCRTESQLYRPAEVETLLGDAEKARVKLGWSPQITFSQLVEEMVEGDLEFLEKGRAQIVEGQMLSAV